MAIGMGGEELQAQSSREYAIKAVFIFHFIQFVDWPDDAFGDASCPFRIGILGPDPFAPDLEQVIEGQRAKGRSVVLDHYGSAEEIHNCQLLYIHPSVAGRLRTILEKFKGQPILTVSDMAGFAAKGGMIELITEAKVRLRINLEAARRCRLDISTKLLRLSEIYRADRSR